MTRLIFRSSDGQERTYELVAELTVGSGTGNDVVLADPAIAERHCRFLRDDQGRVWLEDLAGSAARTQILPDAQVGLGPWTARLERALVLEVVSPGPLLGNRFPIEKDRLVVGSGPTSDLCIPHESVSARHAQISRFGGKLNLLDLGSSQGTFVDGEAVSSTAFAPGDRLRFGSIELAFVGFASQQPEPEPPPAGEPEQPEAPVVEGPVLDAAPPPRPKRSRTPLWIAVGGFLAASFAFYVASLSEPPPPQARDSRPVPLEDDPIRRQAGCTSLCTPEDRGFDPAGCVRSCQKLLDRDPGFGGMTRAERSEQLAPGYLAFAGDLLERNEPEQAIPFLLLLEQGSASYPTAKELYAKAARRAAERHVKDCQSEVAGGLFEQAYSESCRRALELTCGLPGGPDQGALVRFHLAARNLRKVRGAWTCPANQFTAPFEASQAGDGGDPAETLIRDRYPNPAVAEVMLGYYRTGQASKALRDLKAIEPTASETDRAAIRHLIKLFVTIDSRLMGLKGASNLMFAEQLRQAESRVLPLGLHSPLVGDLDKSKGSLQPGPATADEQTCGPLRLSVERARPGSKDRERLVDYAKRIGCDVSVPQPPRAR